MRREFKYFENGDSSLLYHVSSGKFFRVYKPKVRKQLSEYFFNENKNIYAKNKLNEALNQIRKSKDEKNCVNKCNSNVSPEKFDINRLVISVTNVCNLKCKYCYAQGGSYGLQDIQMTRNTAKKVINYFTNNFKSIKTIQFFGGEPSINWPIIQYICNYIKEANREKIIDYMPNFSFITNGYNLDDDFVDLMEEFNFGVTFSIDGPSHIHNILRPSNTNKKTFKKIKENFFKLKDKGVNVGIEATYTAKHIDENISMIDMVDFFNKEFGVKLPHIVPVMIEEDNELSLVNNIEKYNKYLKELVDRTYDRIIEEKSVITNDLVFRVIRYLFNNVRVSYVCPAGLSTISVSSEGKIHPCFMFTSSDNLSYGTINDDPAVVLNNAVDFYQKDNLKIEFVCKNCWAKKYCSSCLGSFYNYEGDKLIKSKINKAQCFHYRMLLKYSLLKIAEIKSDKKLWGKFNNILTGQDKKDSVC